MKQSPRLRDSLRIERVPDSHDDPEYVVSDRKGDALLRLSQGGHFVLVRLDGLTSLDALRLQLREATGEETTVAELEEWMTELAEVGALVDDSRALRALGYLREQGVLYRSPGADRRGEERGDEGDDGDDGDMNDGDKTGGRPRRQANSNVTSWFDHAVFLLNDGLIERASDIFDRMADATPGDVRIQQIAQHLKFVLAQEQLPDELDEDRRDVDWAAFDAALTGMLGTGRCPACEAPVGIELGAMNRCTGCGASFSTWVLEQATPEEERRTDAEWL